mgnify:CR=1 FL=1
MQRNLKSLSLYVLLVSLYAVQFCRDSILSYLQSLILPWLLVIYNSKNQRRLVVFPVSLVILVSLSGIILDIIQTIGIGNRDVKDNVIQVMPRLWKL